MRKMPTDSWSKWRIFCGIKSRVKEERNTLTEVAHTEQRKPTSNVGANERRKDGRAVSKLNLDAMDEDAG